MLNKNNKKQILNKLNENNFLKLKEKVVFLNQLKNVKHSLVNLFLLLKKMEKLLEVVSEGDLFSDLPKDYQ